MSKDLDVNKKEALAEISSLIDSLDSKKASILCYWLKDYAKFLKKEDIFNPTDLLTYRRGSVVKVHLGYRIGNEEGGLHYAIVVESNERSSGVVTVVPLTSIKTGTDLESMHRSRVSLGDEIYQLLNKKLTKAQNEFEEVKKNLEDRLAILKGEDFSDLPEDEKRQNRKPIVSLEKPCKRN